jgi:hypothetical protein
LSEGYQDQLGPESGIHIQATANGVVFPTPKTIGWFSRPEALLARGGVGSLLKSLDGADFVRYLCDLGFAFGGIAGWAATPVGKLCPISGELSVQSGR